MADGITLTPDGQVYITTDPVGPGSFASAGFYFNAAGQLHVTTTQSPSDVYIDGRRHAMTGELVVGNGNPANRPYFAVNGLPFRKTDNALVRQVNQTPDPTDPYVHGIRVGPLGGVYMVTADVPPEVEAEPVINGTPEVGVVTTYTPAVVSGGAAFISRTWAIDGAPVGSAPTYTPTETDYGKELTISEVWSNSGGTVTATSLPAPVVVLYPGIFADVPGLLSLPSTIQSIHAADGPISVVSGKLLAIIVLDPGTAGTFTVYDNPSAPSGTILRTSPAGLVKGQYVSCGAYGLPFATGAYLDLGGTATPVLLCIFEGELPPVTYTGTEMWFDGIDGDDTNDGLSESTPRKTCNQLGGAQIGAGDWILHLKSGTVVQWPTTAFSSITGTSWKLDTYGGSTPGTLEMALATTPYLTSAAFAGGIVGGSGYTDGTYTNCALTNVTGSGTGCNATIVVLGGTITTVTPTTRGYGYYIGDIVTCTDPRLGAGTGFQASLMINYTGSPQIVNTGLVGYENVIVRYVGGNTGLTGGCLVGFGIGIGTARCIINNCVSENFSAGINWGGNYSRVTNSEARGSNSGFICASTSGPAANYSLVANCFSTNVTNDGISHHDGTGVGVCNVTSNCKFTSGSENTFDTQDQYKFNALLFSDLQPSDASTLASLVYDITTDDGIIIGNRFELRENGAIGPGQMLLRGTRLTIVGNYIDLRANTTCGGIEVAAATGGHVIRQNTIIMRVDTNRNALVTPANVTNTEFINNLIVSEATTTARLLNLPSPNINSWNIDYNCYWQPLGTRWAFNGTDYNTFPLWQAGTAGAGFPADVNGLNIDPALDSQGKPSSASPILTSGQASPVMYLGRYGPFVKGIPTAMGWSVLGY